MVRTVQSMINAGKVKVGVPVAPKAQVSLPTTPKGAAQGMTGWAGSADGGADMGKDAGQGRPPTTAFALHPTQATQAKPIPTSPAKPAPAPMVIAVSPARHDTHRPSQHAASAATSTPNIRFQPPSPPQPSQPSQPSQPPPPPPRAVGLQGDTPAIARPYASDPAEEAQAAIQEAVATLRQYPPADHRALSKCKRRVMAAASKAEGKVDAGTFRDLKGLQVELTRAISALQLSNLSRAVVVAGEGMPTTGVAAQGAMTGTAGVAAGHSAAMAGPAHHAPSGGVAAGMSGGPAMSGAWGAASQGPAAAPAPDPISLSAISAIRATLSSVAASDGIPALQAAAPGLVQGYGAPVASAALAANLVAPVTAPHYAAMATPHAHSLGPAGSGAAWAMQQAAMQQQGHLQQGAMMQHGLVQQQGPLPAKHPHAAAPAPAPAPASQEEDEDPSECIICEVGGFCDCKQSWMRLCDSRLTLSTRTCALLCSLHLCKLPSAFQSLTTLALLSSSPGRGGRHHVPAVRSPDLLLKVRQGMEAQGRDLPQMQQAHSEDGRRGRLHC